MNSEEKAKRWAKLKAKTKKVLAQPWLPGIEKSAYEWSMVVDEDAPVKDMMMVAAGLLQALALSYQSEDKQTDALKLGEVVVILSAAAAKLDLKTVNCGWAFLRQSLSEPAPGPSIRDDEKEERPDTVDSMGKRRYPIKYLEVGTVSEDGWTAYKEYPGLELHYQYNPPLVRFEGNELVGPSIEDFYRSHNIALLYQQLKEASIHAESFDGYMGDMGESTLQSTLDFQEEANNGRGA